MKNYFQDINLTTQFRIDAICQQAKTPVFLLNTVDVIYGNAFGSLFSYFFQTIYLYGQ